MNTVRELRHWGPASLQQLRSELQAHTLAWCERWGVSAAVSVDCGLFSVAMQPDGQSLPLPRQWLPLDQRAPEKMVLIGIPDAGAASKAGTGMFSALLFPPVDSPSEPASVPAGPIARQVAEEAFADWSKWLLGEVPHDAPPSAEDSPPQPLPADWVRPWSGAVWTRLGIGESVCWVALSAGTVRQLVPEVQKTARKSSPRAEPALLETALSTNTLRFEAELKPSPLSVSDLVGLRVGDVLRTDHRLDQPLHLVDTNRTTACNGYLGHLAQRRALMLVPATQGTESALRSTS